MVFTKKIYQIKKFKKKIIFYKVYKKRTKTWFCPHLTSIFILFQKIYKISFVMIKVYNLRRKYNSRSILYQRNTFFVWQKKIYKRHAYAHDTKKYQKLFTKFIQAHWSDKKNYILAHSCSLALVNVCRDVA